MPSAWQLQSGCRQTPSPSPSSVQIASKLHPRLTSGAILEFSRSSPSAVRSMPLRLETGLSSWAACASSARYLLLG